MIQYFHCYNKASKNKTILEGNCYFTGLEKKHIKIKITVSIELFTFQIFGTYFREHV